MVIVLKAVTENCNTVLGPRSTLEPSTMPGTVSCVVKDLKDLGKDIKVYANFLRQILWL